MYLQRVPLLAFNGGATKFFFLSAISASETSTLMTRLCRGRGLEGRGLEGRGLEGQRVRGLEGRGVEGRGQRVRGLEGQRVRWQRVRWQRVRGVEGQMVRGQRVTYTYIFQYSTYTVHMQHIYSIQCMQTIKLCNYLFEVQSGIAHVLSQ